MPSFQNRKQTNKQSAKQSQKLKTMAAECAQLPAAHDIQIEHSRLRASVITEQASEITVLKAALAMEKRMTAALYERSIQEAEVSVEKDVKIESLEVEVDHWLDTAASVLELYHSAEAEAVMFREYIKRDPITMAVVNDMCEDHEVKEAVEGRMIAAQIEGEIHFTKEMQRAKLD
jgi:hypothetical protein